MTSGMRAIAASLLRGRAPRGIAGGDGIGARANPFAPAMTAASDPPRGRSWTREAVSRHAASATLLLSPLDFILSCIPPPE